MERIFNSVKFKYEYLNKEFVYTRASKHIKNINIFINLDDFFHKMHNTLTDKEMHTAGSDSYKQFVSNIMNLVGHYKNWAVKESLYPTIYLIYTTAKTFKNAIRINKYRDYYRHINDINNPKFFYINNTIINSIPIMEVIVKYIPNVYTINTDYIEPSIVPYFINKIKPKDFNFLISRDDYDLQYTSFPDWAILRVKGQNSIYITQGNLWKFISEKAFKNNEYNDIYLSSNMYQLALAILGDKYRNIPKLTRTSWKTIIKYLESCSGDNNSMYELQKKKLVDYINEKKIKDTDFNTNSYCTSVYQQVESLLDSDVAHIILQLEDMQDMQELQRVNSTIFKEYPLNLPFLIRERVDYTDKHDDYFWRK